MKSHPRDNSPNRNRDANPALPEKNLPVRQHQPDESSPAKRSSSNRLETVALHTSLVPLDGVNRDSVGKGKTAPVQSLPAVEEATEVASGDLRQRINRNRRTLSSILLSTILHTSLFMALALMVLHRPQTPTISFESEVVAERRPEQPAFDFEAMEVAAPDESHSPVELEFNDVADNAEAMESEDANSEIQLPREIEQPAQQVVEGPAVSQQVLPTGGGLQGRTTESRALLAATRGGSEASEAAVEQGLRWIIDHQNSNGSWYLMHTKGPCNGQCGNPGKKESPNAATGLALMALLGAGYTHRTGPYQTEMKLGVDYLVHRIKRTPHGGSLVDDSMYAHGIATIALAEAFHMTRDPDLKEPVQQLIKYIASAQHPRGGWRYTPGQPGDMTVTGWQIMALKSGQMAGFEVPQDVLQRAQAFVDSLGESGGAYYGYQDAKKKPACTAIGLLSQMYLGWSREKAALNDGTNMLIDQGPSRSNVYYNYYAAQVLHHVGGDDWKRWNRELRDYLVETQDRGGHQLGSWFFRDEHGSVGGRLYTTAMCVMTLEVYYRYLPLYDDIGIGD